MVELGSRVYEDLGDYGTILPGWLEHPGVLPYIDDTDGHCRGFILLGFYVPRDAPTGAFVADLLAIAVEPLFQRQGVGRSLLAYAIEVAELTSQQNHIPEMRLTVADGNHAGQSLFSEAGFVVLDDDHGNYDGGQRAIRMRLPLGVARKRAHLRGV